MNTVREYINKGLNVTPCTLKIPKKNNWQETKATLSDFDTKDNIGLVLDNHSDVDVDNPLAREFINKGYLKPCSSVYGRKSNPRSHFVFKGVNKHKKFALHKDLENWFKKFPHRSTLIELRSGEGKQSVVPGSTVEGEKVEWSVYEGISPYDGELYDDVGKIATATALTILYPPKGSRDDFCYAIACILAEDTDWKTEDIDKFVDDIAKVSGDPDSRDTKGTHARKQIEEKNRLMKYTTLKQILGLNSFQSLVQIFGWIGASSPNEKLMELTEKYFYFEDIGEMYDPAIEQYYKKTEFNNKWLYDFPGDKKGTSTAFNSLLKHPSFQEKKLISRQFLPHHDFPIAEVKVEDKHPLLMPGKYFNLYSGHPLIDDEGDVSMVIKHYVRIFGEVNWEHIEQYIAFCVRNPGVKTRWLPLIVSVEGVGKGLLMRMISKMLGYKYVNENVSFKDITEKHSTIVVGSLFICLNEVVLDKQYSTKRTISSQIKPFISDDFLNINEKGKNPFKYLNNCNGMIFSNDKDCLHVDTSSRRYLVIHCKTTAKVIEKITADGVFDEIFKKIDEEPEHLYDYFLNQVQIEDEKIYQKRAPKTAELLEMIDDSKHDTVAELDDALRDGAPPFDQAHFRGFISLENLLNFIRHKWNTPYPPRKLVKEWLKDKSKEWKPGERTRQVVMSNKQRPRVHLLIKGPKAEMLKTLTEGQLGELMSMKTPGYYWENLKLDYFMREAVTKDEFGDHYNWKDNSKDRMVWFDQEDMIRRAIYYLKFMEPHTVEKIIKVKKELLEDEKRIKKTFTEPVWHPEMDRWLDTLDYAKFNDAYGPLETKAHRLIDKISKAENKVVEEEIKKIPVTKMQLPGLAEKVEKLHSTGTDREEVMMAPEPGNWEGEDHY